MQQRNQVKALFFLLILMSLCSNCDNNRQEGLRHKLPIKTGNKYIDVFLADGDSLITRPEHLGIVNGIASVGIRHDFLGVIDGFWAQPFVSSNFFIEPRFWGERIKTEHYTWLPFQTKQAGVIHGVEVNSITTLIYGMRAGILSLELKNTTNVNMEIPIQFIANDPFTYKGTLDYVLNWSFLTPKSQKEVTDIVDNVGIKRIQGEYAIAFGTDVKGFLWEESTRRFQGSLSLLPGKEISINLAFSMGKVDDAIKERNTILENPSKCIEVTTADYVSQVKHIFSRLPEFDSDNQDLVQLYNRSLSVFITNKMQTPEFVLTPLYVTGSVKGGCNCVYLYNFGQVREILALLDPDAVKMHILQFLRTNCVEKHYAFYPMTGEAFGDWYMVNHEKITGLVYSYIKTTGDYKFLDTNIKGHKTVLDIMVDCALFGNDISKSEALIDYAKYGSVNSHLELRRTELGYEYSHVMPDLNGRRYFTYFKVSELCKLAGKSMPVLMERAEQLKHLLKKQLWNPQIKWFNFINSKGNKDVRWTVQMFKMFEGNVLDDEEKLGLICHLSPNEFFSDYGFHSLSKIDHGYDQVDVDNGGGGTF